MMTEKQRRLEKARAEANRRWAFATVHRILWDARYEERRERCGACWIEMVLGCSHDAASALLRVGLTGEAAGECDAEEKK